MGDYSLTQINNGYTRECWNGQKPKVYSDADESIWSKNNTEETKETKETEETEETKGTSEDKNIFQMIWDFITGKKESEDYYPLANSFAKAKTPEEREKLAKLQEAQDKVGSWTKEGDDLCLTIELEGEPEEMGITLGDLKVLYGIKSGAITQHNDFRYYPRTDSDQTNLDSILVTSGTKIHIKTDEISEPSIDGHKYVNLYDIKNLK